MKWDNANYAQQWWTSEGSDAIQTIPLKMNQRIMKWNNTNSPQQWRTREGSETIQIMLINNEPVKHEMKQNKPCPVRKNRWIMKWNNTNHAQ